MAGLLLWLLHRCTDGWQVQAPVPGSCIWAVPQCCLPSLSDLFPAGRAALGGTDRDRAGPQLPRPLGIQASLPTHRLLQQDRVQCWGPGLGASAPFRVLSCLGRAQGQQLLQPLVCSLLTAGFCRVTLSQGQLVPRSLWLSSVSCSRAFPARGTPGSSPFVGLYSSRIHCLSRLPACSGASSSIFHAASVSTDPGHRPGIDVSP